MTKIKTTYIYDDETDTAELTELEEIKNLKDFKLYTFEGDVYVKAEDYKKIAIENKNLKKERELLIEDYTADRELYNQIVNKQLEYYKEVQRLKKELEETEKTLFHRDSFFSIMRDVLANDAWDYYEICTILYNVVHSECGDDTMNKRQKEIVKKFRKRGYT